MYSKTEAAHAILRAQKKPLEKPPHQLWRLICFWKINAKKSKKRKRDFVVSGRECGD